MVTVSPQGERHLRVIVQTLHFAEEIKDAFLAMKGVTTIERDFMSAPEPNDAVYLLSFVPRHIISGMGPNVAMAVRQATGREIELIVTSGSK